MKLIVGLGNIGNEFSRTRHNLGFMLVDTLAEQHNATWSEQAKFFAQTASYQLDGEKVVIAKPTTLMNRSGKSVAALVKYYDIALKDVWVLSDDLDLEFGKLRLRVGGTSGGHNGLKSIIEASGEGFVRLRMGIKTPRLATVDSAAFVLENFSSDETKQLPSILKNGQELLLDGLKSGGEHTSTSIVTS